MTEQAAVTNPYVGPRTFTYEQRHLFFGREREARDLLARIVSERLLLFYAQSGAGKSSLLQARIIPQLRTDKGLGVLPVARVSGDLPPGVSEVDNIYLFNLLTSIDEGDRPARLTSVTLRDFLARLVRREGRWLYDPDVVPEPPSDQPGRRYALIVDQFEEIITAHPSRWREREHFFRQLEEAMKDDPNLWVILTLREDYVAALDPYAQLMTDRLRARFYMERMGVEAGLEAVRRPAHEIGGRPFDDGVAEQLVDDLRQVRVPGQEQTVAGQYLEPVQLQVVCYQLWEKIKEQPLGPITLDDLEQAGDVDQALAGFYEVALNAVLSDPSMPTTEGTLRSWFETKLITEAGTRGSVYQGWRSSAGMSNRVVESLSSRFLLRRELRSGGAWIELVHDRFVEPIRRSNREWLDRQSPTVRAARDWEDRGRPADLLLVESQLETARLEAATNHDPLLAAFLEASIEAANAREEERMRKAELEKAQLEAIEANARREAEELRAWEADARRMEQAAAAARLRRFVVALVILALFAGVAAAAAMVASSRASAERDNAMAWRIAEADARQIAEAEFNAASTAQVEAVAARSLAERSATEAVASQQTAEAERESASLLAQNLAAVLTSQAPTAVPTAQNTPTLAAADVVLTRLADQTQQSANLMSRVLLPTATPTPTHTPTPNSEATDIVARAKADLEKVQATQTAVAGAATAGPQSTDLDGTAQAETPQVQPSATETANPSQTIPETDGLSLGEARVISFGGAEGDYLLDDPNDQLSGTRWIPVGSAVLLLDRTTGDPAYGSGIWYRLRVTDPEDASQSIEGYLPQEVLSSASRSTAPTERQIVSGTQDSEVQPVSGCRDGWRIAIDEASNPQINDGQIHRGYVTVFGEAADSPYRLSVAALVDGAAADEPLWSALSYLSKEEGVLAVLDTHNWPAGAYEIKLSPLATDSEPDHCTLVVDIPSGLPIPGITFDDLSQSLPTGPAAASPASGTVISADTPELIFEWEAGGLDRDWVYDLLIQRVENDELVDVNQGGTLEWRLPTPMARIALTALGGPGTYQWQVRYAENEAPMLHRSGAWGPPNRFVIQ